MKYKIVINREYGGFSLSQKAIDWLKARGYDPLSPNAKKLERHDPLLVECVETLGKEANGEYSDIAIVEIDNRWYRVCEYDGAEWVETPDSIDWVIIK